MVKSSMISLMAVAVLLISLASLSSATCPWFLRGEIYNAQCGVIKAVPASAGILANDPQAVAVLNPESIALDPKYGTIKVSANGSFVYNPAKNIRQGTIVQFKYTATNGKCQAYVPATAKFQVTCRCKPYIVTVDPIMLPMTLEEIKDIIREAGVGCIGCGDITIPIDLKDIDLDGDGMPLAGTYNFCIKCPGCQVACGQITLIGGCVAEAEDLAFCEGTVALDELMAMAKEKARCVGCDLIPVLDFTDVTVDDDGYVTGGSYTATCGESSQQGNSDTGYIAVWPKCDVTVPAPGVEICAGSTLAELQASIGAAVPACTGSGCDASPVISFENVITENGFVTGGTYTVTCITGQGCEASAEGRITITPGCDAVAPSIEICEGSTQEELEAAISAAMPACTGSGCDATLAISYQNVEYDDNEFVMGGSYTAACITDNGCKSSAEGPITVVKKCSCELIGLTLGSLSPEDIEREIMDTQIPCPDCDATPVYDFPDWPVEDGMVLPGSYNYTVTCPDAGGLDGCDSICTGEVAVNGQLICPCEVENYTFCEGTLTLDELMAMAEAEARCPDCELIPVLDFSRVTVDDDGYVTGGSYEGGCGEISESGSTATGYITIWPVCDINAPDVVVYKESTLEELKAAIDAADPGCTGSGCDASPVISLDNVSLENGFISGGTYAITCITGQGCEASAEGRISIAPECGAVAPSIEICEGSTQEELEAAIDAAGPACTGSGCDATLAISYQNVEYDDNGFVMGGSYTATCISGDGRATSVEGSIIVIEKCGCDLIAVATACASPEVIEREIMNEQIPCVGCDASPFYDFPDWSTENGMVLPGSYEYTVTCPDAGGLEGCDSVCTGQVDVNCQIVCPCQATAPDIPICPDEVTLDELVGMIEDVAQCNPLPGTGRCDSTPQIDTIAVVIEKGYVVPGTSSYRIVCQPDDSCEAVEARGRITTRSDCESCDCTATAPDICLPIVCADTPQGFVCRDYSTDYYMHFVTCAIESANGGCPGDCSEMKVLIPNNIRWDEPTRFEYTLVCGSEDCAKSAKGWFTLDWNCGCGPCGCGPCGC